jgi:hypothetical protein
MSHAWYWFVGAFVVLGAILWMVSGCAASLPAQEPADAFEAGTYQTVPWAGFSVEQLTDPFWWNEAPPACGPRGCPVDANAYE